MTKILAHPFKLRACLDLLSPPRGLQEHDKSASYHLLRQFFHALHMRARDRDTYRVAHGNSQLEVGRQSFLGVLGLGSNTGCRGKTSIDLRPHVFHLRVSEHSSTAVLALASLYLTELCRRSILGKEALTEVPPTIKVTTLDHSILRSVSTINEVPTLTV